MRPGERLPPDDLRESVNRAGSYLARARTLIPTTYLDDAWFDAQQAAEKGIKAVMVLRGIGFPYIHELHRLLETLQAEGVPIPDSVRRADDLTQCATASRYPGSAEPVTEQDHSEAVKHAQAVVRWAETLL